MAAPSPDDVKDSTRDNWLRAVHLLTGYKLPDRPDLFKDLKGNDDIPLMHVRLAKESDDSKFDPEFLRSGGWRTENTDYTIPFYGADGPITAGMELDKYRLYFTFPIHGQSALPPAGHDDIDDFEHTNDVLKSEGPSNAQGEAVTWNTHLLTQYIYGSRDVLQHLIDTHTTFGYESRGIAVDDANYVNLRSFTDAALAFDRVVKFFEESAHTVEKWDLENIGEGSESWDGTSAAIFKALIHKLARNYEGYAEQVRGEGGEGVKVTIDEHTVTSQPAQLLVETQEIIYNQAQELIWAWNSWRPESNPQRWLYDMLEDARYYITDYFLTQSDIEVKEKPKFEEEGDGLSLSDTTSVDYEARVVAKPGFKYDVAIGWEPEAPRESFGAPDDMATWKKIGERAVKRWEDSVQGFLSAKGI